MRGDEIVEKIIETSRDVKCIRAEIADLKKHEKELERRIAAVEMQNPHVRADLASERRISAGIAAGAGSIAAVILRFLGG